MKLSSQQDVSLYELALSAENPPHPLQISPTIFKSLVSSFIDLLIEQELTATIWLKLPKGEVWQSEIERFRRTATAPYTLYVLGNEARLEQQPGTNGAREASPQAEDSPENGVIPGYEEDQQAPEALVADDIQSSWGGGSSKSIPATDSAQTFYLSLSGDNHLRREYFLLVLTSDFSGLLLSHRPRSVRPARSEAGPDTRAIATARAATSTTSPKPDPKMTDLTVQGSEDEQERKHPLLALCSFDPQILRQVLVGVASAIAPTSEGKAVQSEIEELLNNWDSLTELEMRRALNPVVFGQLLTRQIRNLEDIWHSSAAFRRQAEAATALQMENEELQNAIRLKDEFLQNVGQELRTPLATMKTALKLLNSPNLRPNQRQRYMDMLEQECDRQSALITSVLDLIQIETFADQTTAQPLRLADVVPGVVSTYQPLAQEKGIMLAYTVSEDLPAVSCSVQTLRQVVINLLHNGIKFTPAGGRVWVRAKHQGDYVQLDVQDTGIGIAQAEIPKIFERFYRVRQGLGDDSSGAGLGLSIVQQLLLKSGGSISVKSEPGEGSTFTVLLPIYVQSS